MVAPGAVVAPGTTVSSGQVWSGNPAKLERKLSPEEVASIATLAHNTRELADKHRHEHDKTEAVRQEERDTKEFSMPPESIYRETPF